MTKHEEETLNYLLETFARIALYLALALCGMAFINKNYWLLLPLGLFIMILNPIYDYAVVKTGWG